MLSYSWHNKSYSATGDCDKNYIAGPQLSIEPYHIQANLEFILLLLEFSLYRECNFQLIAKI